MPYQATAIKPRMTAGIFAPNTPNASRQITGYGTAACWLGLATRLAINCTMQIPPSKAINTCQLANPSANRLAANT
ncbi:hypothetical protein D3C81_1899360 [compost metagenome]